MIHLGRSTCAALLLASVHASQSPAAPAQPGNVSAPSSDTDPLYEAGKQLFDQLAPPEVKEQYEFPTPEQWNKVAADLQAALNSDSLPDLAQYAPQARSALTTLRTLGVDDDLADWLEQRLDEAEGAQEAGNAPTRPPAIARPTPPPKPAPGPKTPSRPPTAIARIPHLALWTQRVQDRPVPARAAALMPMLRSAFAAEGVPTAIAWLAEAESSFNPTARSPSGAKGLYQLMPDTAKTLGLSTFLPDERTDPAKSARAAARYLRELHAKFDDWPLTFAAYNAGEGRVSRALAARKAKDFAGIAEALPAETRMYVPKVCALIATRSGQDVSAL
jgi:membrane-bound lytic murein transglycosylase D